MLSIGITGSFASGKSYVLNLIAEEGYKIFSSDECVSNLYENKAIQNQILKLIPILKSFDKKKLAEIIYDDPLSRERIESFMHPLVLKEIKNFKEKNSLENFVLIEVPLLFEARWEQYFDFIITIYCSEDKRLEHAKSKVNFDQKIYNKLEKMQFSQAEKMKRADFIINTGVKMVELQTQIANILEKIE